MATGIPSRGRKRKGGKDYRIEYDGKCEDAEILGGARANLARIAGTQDAENRLIYGDNLPAMLSLLDDPSVAGKVRVIYIDPPYAKASNFESRTQDHAYHDHLVGADYLEFLRQRLIVMRELLADDGSLFLHLDEEMAFPAKIVLDEIFGREKFRNIITRKKCNSKNYTQKRFGNVVDYILYYSKESTPVWNQPLEPADEDFMLKEYEFFEEGTGRRYKRVPIHAPGVRKGETGKPWRGMMPPPGKHWQYTPSTLDEMDARGEIYWSSNGNPRRKVYFDQHKGIAVQDLWLDVKDPHNQNVKITGYPTEKNARLVSRVIEAASNPGDLIMDSFSGSGTTASSAEQLGRRWIAIDSSPLAISTTLERLFAGTKAMGDFVGKRKSREQVDLFVAQSLRQSGLSLYAEQGGDSNLDEGVLREWLKYFKDGAADTIDGEVSDSPIAKDTLLAQPS